MVKLLPYSASLPLLHEFKLDRLATYDILLQVTRDVLPLATHGVLLLLLRSYLRLHQADKLLLACWLQEQCHNHREQRHHYL